MGSIFDGIEFNAKQTQVPVGTKIEVEMVDGFACPTDPMEALQCEGCQ